MERLMEYGMQVAATLLITLIGVLGTYLSLQLGKNANLKNINDAQKELIRAAKISRRVEATSSRSCCSKRRSA